MKAIPGFPGKSRYTPIPDLFFVSVLPDTEDLVELKVTLHVFWLLYRKKGYPRFVSLDELVGDPVLARSLRGDGPLADRVRNGLRLAVSRGTLLHVALDRDGKPDDIFFVNNEVERRTVAMIKSGDIKVGGAAAVEPAAEPEPLNIFTLYEQNIGMLSPLIADELKEAEKLYPGEWVEDAFKEAVSLNKRNWKYIARILERWAAEGRGNGESERHSKTDVDPKEYFRKWDSYLGKK